MLLQRILRQHSVALCRAQSTPLRRHTSSFLRPSSPATPQPPTTRRTPAPSSTTSTPQALLAYYSQVPTRGVTLPELSRYGLPPLDQDVLLASAEHTRVELLAGLARRVTAHLSLPFLPATNPSLQSIYALYSNAFSTMAALPSMETLEDNDRLCEAIAKMVEAHRDNIPTLAKGFQESRKYLPDTVITSFLDRAIRNRITLRLIAEQHLSLSLASLPFLRPAASSPTPPKLPSSSTSFPSTSLTPTRIGVLDLALSPHALIDSCAHYVSELCEATYGVAPSYRIEGAGASVLVGTIAGHAEYILTELLKNAFRATVERMSKEKELEEEDDGVFRFDDLPSAHLEKSDLPEVVITVGVVEGVLTIRIRDVGGGIAPANIQSIFSYAFTTVPLLPDPDSDPDSPGSDRYGGGGGGGYGSGGGGQVGSSLSTGMGTLAGLGFGLPLARLYANYFGGSLDVVSMYGHGTDVYVVLRTVS